MIQKARGRKLTEAGILNYHGIDKCKLCDLATRTLRHMVCYKSLL